MGVGNRNEATREALVRDWITVEEVKGPLGAGEDAATGWG